MQVLRTNTTSNTYKPLLEIGSDQLAITKEKNSTNWAQDLTSISPYNKNPIRVTPPSTFISDTPPLTIEELRECITDATTANTDIDTAIDITNIDLTPITEQLATTITPELITEIINQLPEEIRNIANTDPLAIYDYLNTHYDILKSLQNLDIGAILDQLGPLKINTLSLSKTLKLKQLTIALTAQNCTLAKTANNLNTQARILNINGINDTKDIIFNGSLKNIINENNLQQDTFSLNGNDLSLDGTIYASLFTLNADKAFLQQNTDSSTYSITNLRGIWSNTRTQLWYVTDLINGFDSTNATRIDAKNLNIYGFIDNAPLKINSPFTQYTTSAQDKSIALQSITGYYSDLQFIADNAIFSQDQEKYSGLVKNIMIKNENLAIMSETLHGYANNDLQEIHINTNNSVGHYNNINFSILDGSLIQEQQTYYGLLHTSSIYTDNLLLTTKMLHYRWDNTTQQLTTSLQDVSGKYEDFNFLFDNAIGSYNLEQELFSGECNNFYTYTTLGSLKIANFSGTINVLQNAASIKINGLSGTINTPETTFFSLSNYTSTSTATTAMASMRDLNIQSNQLQLSIQNIDFLSNQERSTLFAKEIQGSFLNNRFRFDNIDLSYEHNTIYAHIDDLISTQIDLNSSGENAQPTNIIDTLQNLSPEKISQFDIKINNIKNSLSSYIDIDTTSAWGRAISNIAPELDFGLHLNTQTITTLATIEKNPIEALKTLDQATDYALSSKLNKSLWAYYDYSYTHRQKLESQENDITPFTKNHQLLTQNFSSAAGFKGYIEYIPHTNYFSCGMSTPKANWLTLGLNSEHVAPTEKRPAFSLLGLNFTPEYTNDIFLGIGPELCRLNLDLCIAQGTWNLGNDPIQAKSLYSLASMYQLSPYIKKEYISLIDLPIMPFINIGLSSGATLPHGGYFTSDIIWKPLWNNQNTSNDPLQNISAYNATFHLKIGKKLIPQDANSFMLNFKITGDIQYPKVMLTQEEFSISKRIDRTTLGLNIIHKANNTNIQFFAEIK